MWLALFTALLDWLTGLVKTQSRKTGEDVSGNTELRDRLNARLATWKKKNGVP
ncbi:MAG: hypothetical protein WCR06_04815 [bacterium]